MKTILTKETTDSLLPLVGVTCECPGGTRVLPIRMSKSVLEKLNGSVAPSMLVMTFRCASCQAIVHVRGVHLRHSA